MKKKLSNAEKYGQMLAKRMATRQPMTKRAILKKWPAFGSRDNIALGIDWIEDNTGLSNNPFLFRWEGGEAVWAFRAQFKPIAFNLLWNVKYLHTRVGTFQRVLDHAIDSPVVTMTMAEQRVAKGMLAQMGGVVSYIESVMGSLVKVTKE